MRDSIRERFLDSLSPEVRQRFEAARDQALQDPKLQELKANADKANGEFFKAMREKMLEIDPGLSDIIKQQAQKAWRDHKGPPGGGNDIPGLGNLSDAEKQQFLAAREKAKNDPAVQAAEKQKEDAATPDDRRAAMDAYRLAMRQAILKADPSLAPLLDKIGNKGGPPPAPAASSAPKQ